ncbi:MAG: hypothetical protein QM756_35920 [Polyangiaceae bacterium]
MRSLLRACSLFLFVVAAACNSGSTAAPRSPDDEDGASPAARNDPAYRADIDRICRVDELIDSAKLDLLEVAQKRDDYLVEHVKHPDAIYFLTVFRAKPDSERAGVLQREARDLKIESCPLAKELSADSATANY